VIIDNDIASLYPMTWMSRKFSLKPRTLTLEKLVPPYRHKVRVYVQGGDWWEDKQAMEDWCSERFGPHNKKYNNPRWQRDAFHFLFKNEKDAIFFILKWG
jgi:hypothetical protein